MEGVLQEIEYLQSDEENLPEEGREYLRGLINEGYRLRECLIAMPSWRWSRGRRGDGVW
jgi:hypothetical protein